MIFFDVTKTGGAGHRSGLNRVSAQLAAGLGARCTEIRWPTWDRRVQADDWFFTSELFSEGERPGLTAFLASHACRTAALFHDAIPLQHPGITWPQSVARHPGYMKLLAQFDRVWAVSAKSRDDLAGFWRWQGPGRIPPIDVIALGADCNRRPRTTARPASAPPASLLCLGIIEPRKNQSLLLDACEDLWATGLAFDLHLVGRVNPHFGPPIVARIHALRSKRRGLHFHQHASDEEVARLHSNVRASVFPTLAEGCGLPLLESLWLGLPCVCSDLPVLRENAAGGGCLPVPLDDRSAWVAALRRILTEDALHTRLTNEAMARRLPTWAEAAALLLRELRGPA